MPTRPSGNPAVKGSVLDGPDGLEDIRSTLPVKYETHVTVLGTGSLLNSQALRGTRGVEDYVAVSDGWKISSRVATQGNGDQAKK
jgi:hypothetical protein